MDLSIRMASLFKAGLLSKSFNYYFWLRNLSRLYLGNDPRLRLYGITGAMEDLLEFFGAISEIAQRKELANVQVFPYPRLSFASTIGISEEEVRRSIDTVGKTTYIFNAMQVDARLAGSSPITINPDFCARWNIAIADILAELPKILKIDRLSNFDISGDLEIIWTPLALTHNTYSTSVSELQTFYPLGLSKAAYIFYILQDNKAMLQDGIDLQTISGIDAADTIPALTTLRNKGILDYQIEEIRINWLKTLPDLSLGHTNWLSDLMKTEGKLMFLLKDAFINPAIFNILISSTQKTLSTTLPMFI